MATFYVDAGSGDDSAPATRAEPVATIGRAVELAAEHSDATGSIMLGEGEYRGAPETFPVLMRPGYDLIGAGRELTTIVFTGMTRTTSGPDPVTYWGGTAIIAGRSVRDLTLRMDPFPDTVGPCRGAMGIDAGVDGSVIERVDILAPALPEEIEGHLPHGEWLERGFGTAVLIRGADVTYRDSRVSHSSDVRALYGGAPELSDLVLEASTLVMDNDGQAHRCRFLGAETVGGGSVVIRGGTVALVGGSPRFGPDNFVGRSDRPVIRCDGGATPTIEGNVVSVVYGGPVVHVRGGAAPRFVDNLISAWWVDGLLVIDDDAGMTVFEDNILYASQSYGVEMIRVEAPTDLGGGPAGSAGRNHLGVIDRVHDFVWDIPGGGTVHARDNYWLGGDPGVHSGTGAATTLDAAGARPEGLSLTLLRARVAPLVAEAYDVPWRR